MLFAALPFGAAFVRALQAGHDVRLLWMALASFAGATAAMAVARRASRMPALLSSSASAFLIATLPASSATAPRTTHQATEIIAPANCNYSQMRFQTGRDTAVAFGSRGTAWSRGIRIKDLIVSTGRDRVGELP